MPFQKMNHMRSISAIMATNPDFIAKYEGFKENSALDDPEAWVCKKVEDLLAFLQSGAKVTIKICSLMRNRL